MPTPAPPAAPRSALVAALLQELAAEPDLVRPRALALGRVVAPGALDLADLADLTGPEARGLSGHVLLDILNGLGAPLAITALFLAGDRLGPAAAAAIVGAWERLPGLVRLDLAGNALGERGLAGVIAGLARAGRPIDALDLADNGLGPAALADLARALADRALDLAHLVLGRPGGDPSPANHLDQASADAWAAALAGDPPLASLDLRGVRAPAAMIARIVAPIADGATTRIGRVLVDAPLPPALLARLLARLAHNANHRGARGRPMPGLAELRRAATRDARPSPAARMPTREPAGARPSGLAPGPDDLAAFLRVADALDRRPDLLEDPALAAAAERLLRLRRVARAGARGAARRRADARAAERAADQAADQAAIAATGIRRRRGRGATLAPLPADDLGAMDTAPAGDPRAPHRLLSPLRCYVCKRPYRLLDPFYDRLCPECAERSAARRRASVDLSGRTAVVTGGRIKIGHAVARRLLGWGARVIVTSRFPRDAARRFAADPDFADYADRLEIHGLDLRDLPALETFCAAIKAAHPRLDVLINNAAQTIRRPPAFYAELLALEAAPIDALASPLRRVLAPPAAPAPAALARAPEPTPSALFPAGSDDGFGQPEDHRPTNSWRLRLDEVSTLEAVEAQLINAIAPFVLCARLRPALARPPSSADAAFIVNVSAPEGQFYRAYKAPFHPHTNMAKAALNMITRTSAEDYARDRIFMTSVDTGWASNENPRPIAEAMRARGFAPPLDEVDAATRVCDPIVRGLAEGELLHGVFLKDFRPVPW